MENSVNPPELYRPGLAAFLGLFLTPAFSAYVHQKNWEALGDMEEAKYAKWSFYGSLIVLVLAAIATNKFGLLSVLGLGIWWVALGLKQYKLVKNDLAGNFVKKSIVSPAVKSLLYLFLSGLIIAVVSGAYEKDRKSEDSVAERVEPSSRPVETQPPAVKKKSESLMAAIASHKQIMTDVSAEESNDGAAEFSRWAAQNMKWEELNSLEKTTYKLALKDPESHRGKRLCVEGMVSQIRGQEDGAKRTYWGVLHEGYNVYSFIAVGDTGDIVSDSVASFCGVFTGVEYYSNTDGGSTESASVVGMFDLPSNKKK